MTSGESRDERQCPLCAGSESTVAFAKAGFVHYECGSCTTVFVSPPPDAATLREFYAQSLGEQDSSLCWTGTRRHVHALWRHVLETARTLAGEGPLLDIGCGSGQFLEFAHAQGWRDCTGIEVSEQAASLARSRPGVRVITADLTSVRLEPLRYALVALWDVLEHTADPAALLDTAHGAIRPGGVVVAGTPNRHGISLRVFGRHALTISPPEHLFYPTRTGMRQALERARFVPRATWSQDVYIREWVRAPQRRQARHAERTGYARWYGRLTGSALGNGLIRATNVLLGMTGLGDQLVIIAQKA